MRVDELQTTIIEGITHIEDLDIDSFIKSVKNLNSYEITEKVDGAALQFGMDDNGFFTSREGKGAKPEDRFYDYNQWGTAFKDTGFRSAHKALEKLIAPIYKKTNLLEKGANYAVEVLFGKLPNAIPYSDEINQIIILGKSGTDDVADEDYKKLEKVNKLLANKEALVDIENVPYTEDGISIKRRSEKHNWTVVIVPKVRADDMKKAEAQAVIDREVTRIEKFLRKTVKIGETTLTNADLIALPLNKKPDWLGNATWSDVKAIIKPLQEKANVILKKSKLEIKDVLLNAFVRGQQSAFGPSIKQGGWIEGVVLKSKTQQQDLSKLVDKEIFTSKNAYNWLVRADIDSFKNPESVMVKLRSQMASLLGHPRLARGTNVVRKYMSAFGDSVADQIATIATDVDFKKVKAEWLTYLSDANNRLAKTRDDFKNKTGQYKDLDYQEGVVERTMESFAEAQQSMDHMIKATNQAKSAIDLIMVMTVDKLTEMMIVSQNTLIESGEAIKSSGPIHIDEIDPTLMKISKAIKLPFDMLKDNALGSVGKAEFSGDIDIALDKEEYTLDELETTLRTSGITDTKKSPGLGIISFGFPIENFDPSKKHPSKERTGIVQVDFMLGKPEWLKFGFHSAGDKSKFKGVYRTILISSVSSAMAQAYFDPDTEELIGRFGPALAPAVGLAIKAKMRSRKKLTKADIKAGKQPEEMPYLKGEKVVTPEVFKAVFPDVDIDRFGEKWHMDDPQEVASFLFGDVKPDITPDDLGSVEDVIALVRLKPKEMADQILGRFKNRLDQEGLKMPF